MYRCHDAPGVVQYRLSPLRPKVSLGKRDIKGVGRSPARMRHGKYPCLGTGVQVSAEPLGSIRQ